MTCKLCKVDKPETDYYWRSDRKRLIYVCKICWNIRISQSRANDEFRIPKRAYRKSRRHLPVSKARNKRHVEAYKRRYPEKARAQQLLQRAIRQGIVDRPDRCSKCGDIGKVQGHHFDYTKPLEVKWLCHMCHFRVHAKGSLPSTGD